MTHFLAIYFLNFSLSLKFDSLNLIWIFIILALQTNPNPFRNIKVLIIEQPCRKKRNPAQKLYKFHLYIHTWSNSSTTSVKTLKFFYNKEQPKSMVLNSWSSIRKFILYLAAFQYLHGKDVSLKSIGNKRTEPNRRIKTGATSHSITRMMTQWLSISNFIMNWHVWEN